MPAAKLPEPSLTTALLAVFVLVNVLTSAKSTENAVPDNVNPVDAVYVVLVSVLVSTQGTLTNALPDESSTG